MRKLNEKFNYNDLTDDEKDELYKNFSDTYIRATGAAYTRSEFISHAYKWNFYGTLKGGVTVMPQRCGLLKLTSSYESIDPATGKVNSMEILKGLEELIKSNPDKGIWGAMTPQLAKTLTLVSKRKCPNNSFTIVPAPLVIILGPTLMKATAARNKFLGVIKNPLDPDFGCVRVQTPSGPQNKKLIANRAYYDWLRKAVTDSTNLPVQAAISQFGDTNKFLNLIPGSKKDTDDLSLVHDFLNNSTDL